MKISRSMFDFLFKGFDLEKKVGLTAAGWGLWGIAFNTLGSSPAYVYLLAAGSWFPLGAQAFWGGLAALIGGTQLYGLQRQNNSLRMGAALVASTLWLSLALAFLLHNPRGFALIIYGLQAWGNAALYYQIGTGSRR